MRGFEDLLVMGFCLQAIEDDLQPCCNNPKHKAKFLRKAMTEAARTWHDGRHEAMPGPYFFGPMPEFEKCWAFPCRLIQEFGPETDDDD